MIVSVVVIWSGLKAQQAMPRDKKSSLLFFSWANFIISGLWFTDSLSISSVYVRSVPVVGSTRSPLRRASAAAGVQAWITEEPRGRPALCLACIRALACILLFILLVVLPSSCISFILLLHQKKMPAVSHYMFPVSSLSSGRDLVSFNTKQKCLRLPPETCIWAMHVSVWCILAHTGQDLCFWSRGGLNSYPHYMIPRSGGCMD